MPPAMNQPADLALEPGGLPAMDAMNGPWDLALSWMR